MRLLPILSALTLALFAIPAVAGPIRLVASDDRGVTLQLAVPAYTLEAAAAGRADLIAKDLEVMDVPGRPRVLVASVLIGLPAGARAEARLVAGEAEEMRSGVRLTLGDRPVFREERGTFDLVPGREPAAAIVDGAWPRAAVEVGEPFMLRRQRMVAVRLMPFRYDEAAGQLWARRTMTVRVDFVGGEPARVSLAVPAQDDRHFEPVLREALLNYEQARGWRAPAEPAGRNPIAAASLFSRAGAAGAAGRMAFDESEAEVRVKIDTTGVYQLDYATLAANGYPPNIPIAQVSVHRHEFVENATPPYVTIELPIEVDDRTPNGVFDGNDRIVVWVQSWAQRSRASWAQRQWGDAEVVYATVAGGGGLRLDPPRPGWRDVTGLTPLASYPWTQHWEKNYSYFPFPPDTLVDQFHWTDSVIYYDRQDSIRFETNHLDPAKSATFSLTWTGRREGTHYTWAQLRANGGTFFSVADSLQWSGRGTVTATVSLPGSALGEGNVNTLRCWGRRDGSAPDPDNNNSDLIGINFFEATYWRRYRALTSRVGGVPVRSYLACNTGAAVGDVQILATGFANQDVRVYDVTDSLQPVRLALDPSHVQKVGSEYTVEFQDLVAPGTPRQYVVTALPMIPPAANFSPVARRQLTARARGDYLLIVPEAFLPAVDPLVQLRRSQGLDVVVAPLESVCDEFNGGRKSSYAIKRFVDYALKNWMARFVLLVGDGSEDPLNAAGESSQDWIPVQKINGPVGITFGYEIIPSDPWYVCGKNCDVFGFTPVVQNLYIGRLPVGSLEQARAMIDKLVAYENFGADQTWRNALLLSADDEYSGATFFGGGGSGTTDYCRRPGELVFKQISQDIAELVADGAGLHQAVLDTFYLGDILGDVACVNPTPADPCPCRDLAATKSITHGSVTKQLTTRLSAGRLWWNFQGHANEYVLTHEDLFINSPLDRDLIMNDGKPFLFAAFSCHANAFARYGDIVPGRGPSLGEQFVNMVNRGAIGSWASSGYETLPGYHAPGQPLDIYSHINVTWADAMFRNPPHDEYLGEKGARVVLGETIGLALLNYVPRVISNLNERGIALTYQLLGDPATRLSIGSPQAKVTANLVPVENGQPVRLHTLGDTLRLEADLASNVALTQLSLERTVLGGTPQLVPATDYTLTPAFPDTSGRRYQLSYGTTLAPDSYRYTFHTVDRYGLVGNFDAVFQFLTQLRLDQAVIVDGDPVPPAGNLSLKILSPRPLDPLADLGLRVNGIAQAFTATPVAGDPSGREWILTWDHAPYAKQDYEVRLSVNGGADHVNRFRVAAVGGELQIWNLIAFPNPMDDLLGTAFSFLIVSAAPADVQIRVFTTSGRLVYERIERGLAPGYHQIQWRGLDAEGDKLANGVYLYRVLATNGSSKAEQLGRLVRIRKPRRGGSS